jgi:beta-alanine--pyruvate transaminase
MSWRGSVRRFGVAVFWMLLMAGLQFKSAPQLLASRKEMYYTSHDDRSFLDGPAGLWCVNSEPLSR